MKALKNQIETVRRAQAALAGAVVVLVAAFYLGGYRPQTVQLRQLQTELGQKKCDLDTKQAQTGRLPYLVAEIGRRKAELEGFQKLPAQAEIGDFMRQITQLSQEATIQGLEVSFPSGPRRGDQFAELPVHLKFNGDFVNVFSFIRHAEEMSRLTRIVSIDIRGLDDAKGNVGVDLSMSLYFSEG